jgi:hypothetical protein
MIVAKTVDILSDKAIRDLRADHDRLAHEVAALRVQLRAAFSSVTDGPYEVAKAGTGGISTGSGIVPGSGTADIYRVRADGTVVTYRTATVYNWCGEIDGGAYIGVFKDAAGRYWTANGRC